MSQPQQMNMGGMGGPVGGPGAAMQPNNAGTPGSAAAMGSLDSTKRLNTAIYDYLLRNGLYDIARQFYKSMDIDTEVKKSPGQGNQPNGVDNMEIDSKEIRERPDDLPAPAHLGDGPFLQDWWCQFWELYLGHRGKGKPNTLQYIGAQRQAQKARNGMMNNSNMPMGMMGQMNNGMMPQDIKRVAMQRNQQQNLTPQQMATMQNMQANKQNAMVPGAQMERQGSQMDMGGQRTGSPNSGDAPSPKRARMDNGNMQPMQGRPGGPPGQMQGQSMETYSQSIHQTMKAAMNQANSNTNKGMPPNAAMGPGAQQGSPMSQAGMDGGSDFYSTNNRMGNMAGANAAAGAQVAQGGTAGGNHALQDYQMQLMLLEQQNKKRLLMARQEQDTMTQHGGPPGPPGPGPNGQFVPGMSPQGSRQGDPSPNPNDMQRGTPKVNKPGMSPNGDMTGRGSPQPGMMHQNIPPELRAQMMQNGGNMMRPPSSHPMPGGMTPDQQMRMFQQQPNGQMMPNGWQGQPPPQGMMPGQQQGQPGQPPANMTPRQPNQMPPPPAPASGTQPSSPSTQAPAPPTPNPTNKSKPGGKKEANKKGNKKGAANATPASEAEQPPTPTPATPMTPMNAQNFQKQGQGMPNGQPQPNQPNASQPGSNAVQPPAPAPDMNATFGDGMDYNMSLELADFSNGDVLDNFDFDSFLNTNDGDGGFGFDANLAFGDPSIEAGGDLGPN